MAFKSGFDENGHDAYIEDWNGECGIDVMASNGLRIGIAMALEIAADELRGDGDRWNARDKKLARAAIAGLRMQSAIEDVEAHCEYLSHQCDIWIYG